MTPFILWELTTARQKICRAQTVDKVSHYCAGFFFAKYQNVQCLCGFFGTFLV